MVFSLEKLQGVGGRDKGINWFLAFISKTTEYLTAEYFKQLAQNRVVYLKQFQKTSQKHNFKKGGKHLGKNK